MMFLYDPAVFAVGTDYQIVFLTESNGMAWVDVGGRRYYDEVNGLLRSETNIHKMILPMKCLDQAEEYTVWFRPIIERSPYYPKSGEPVSRTYRFRPVDESDGLQFYQLADTHTGVAMPANAAGYFGDKLDFLLLNGDIGDESNSIDAITTIHKIAANVTHGSIPVVYVRGNHDTRGLYAPILGDYIGTDHGRTYFTFRLGSMLGIVLDSGEDKPDSSIEYSGTIAFERFRRAQTEFLKEILRTQLSEDVKCIAAFCHIPFTMKLNEVAEEIFNEWTALLGEIGISFMLCGHMHKAYFIEPGSDKAFRRHAFPVIVGSEVGGGRYIGTAVEIKEKLCRAEFTDQEQNAVNSYIFKISY